MTRQSLLGDYRTAALADATRAGYPYPDYCASCARSRPICTSAQARHSCELRGFSNVPSGYVPPAMMRASERPKAEA